MTRTRISFRYVVLTVFLTASLTSLSIADIWYVDSDIGAGGDGTSWATAFDTIAEAITAASPLYTICFSPTDQIYVKSGTYSLAAELTLNKTVILYGGFPNTVASPTLSQRNPDVYPTIIDGNNSVRCMTVTAYSIINGFIFQNGYTTGNGGALYADETPTYDCPVGDLSTSITNCKFLNNYAGVHGGAIYDLRSNLIISDCLFEGNSADNGGAIKQWETTSTIEKCIFNANESTTGGGFGGGAILGDYLVYGSITNCLFTNNTSASNGGAISYHMGYPTIINCTFADNTTTTGGGAIYNNTAAPTLKNCILWDDTPDEVVSYFHEDGPYISYSDIEGGWAGLGASNIDSDPLFVSSSDYHLDIDSPCVDTGTNTGAPNEDLDDNPRPLDGNADDTAVTDMGAYETTNIDLQITGIDLNPAAPRVGEPVTVTVTVHNSGSTDAGKFYLDWYADRDTPPVLGNIGNKWKEFNGLAAGSSDTMVDTYTYTTEGSKTMYAQVDTENDVGETSETNNIYGPISTWAMTGVLLDFNIIHNESNVSHWFGGDDRATKRNVGVGQSITPTRPAHVTSAGFRFTGRFDYFDNPEGTGHSIILNTRVRKSDGTVIKSVNLSVPSAFNGGWIMVPFGNLWLEQDQTYIFTSYVYQGESNELSTYVYARSDNPWPTSTGYRAIVYTIPADMASWANWDTHSYDFNFQMKGQYIEHYPGDLNLDGAVDLDDVDVIGQYWLADDCIMPGWCDLSDINWNSHVTLEDFNVLARYWQETY